MSDRRTVLGVATALVSSTVVAVLVVGSTADAAPPVAAVAGASGPPAEEVRDTYLRDCAVCHGAEGRGTPRGPNLVGIGRALTDYQLSTGRMPIAEPDDETRRSPPKYPPAMIAGLVDYVADFGGGGVDIPDVDLEGADVAAGGELYRLQCAACHAWAGNGGALLRFDAPRVDESTPTQIAEAVRAGPGTMPAFGEAAITDDQIASLVAYVRSLDDTDDRGGQPLWHLGPLPEGAVAWIVGMGALLLLARAIGDRR